MRVRPRRRVTLPDSTMYMFEAGSSKSYSTVSAIRNFWSMLHRTMCFVRKQTQQIKHTHLCIILTRKEMYFSGWKQSFFSQVWKKTVKGNGAGSDTLSIKYMKQEKVKKNKKKLSHVR